MIVLIAESARRVRVATSLPTWLVLAAPVLLLPQIVCSIGTALTWNHGVASLFDVNGEANLPAWWSSTLLLTIAAAGAGVAAYERYVRNRMWHWALLSLGFVGLSLEEVAGIHERIGSRVSVANSATGTASDWVIVYAPILLLGVAVIVLAIRDLGGRRAVMGTAGLALFVSVIAAEATTISNGTTLAEALYEENAEFTGEILIALAVTWQLVESIKALVLRTPPHLESQ